MVDSISNTIRFTGLASGLDTESIVSNLMKVEKMSVEKVEKQKQLAEWSQEQYREIVNALRAFDQTYFDYLNPENNMFSSSTFKQFSVASSDNTVVRATGTSLAMESSHTVKVNNVATAASIKSAGKVTKSVQGSNGANFTSLADKTFKMSIDGTSYVIRLNEDVTDISSLQAAIDETVGSGKVAVSDVGGGVLAFEPAENGVHKISLSYGSNDALTDLGFNDNSTFSNRISLSMTLEEISNKLESSFVFYNDKLSMTINGVDFSFDKGTTLSNMLNEINSNTDAGITAKYNELGDTFEFYSKQTGEGNSVKLESDGGSFFFNAINLSSSYAADTISGLSELDFSGANAKNLDIVIDGERQQIVLDGNYSLDGDYNNLLNDLEDKIEAAYGFEDNSIRASLDSDNKLNLQILSGGTSLLIQTGENSALADLGLEANYIEGEDAQVIVDGETIIRADNTFTIEGIEYTVLKESVEEQSISLELNADEVYDRIDGFVKAYNGLVTLISTKINEEYDRDYQPLTDEEKEAMSEEQIEKWETQAKKGLLRNDSLLQKVLSDMRTAFYASIENVSVSMYDIGITTGDYEQNGQLEIDEEKLKTAIENNPDSIMQLFTKPPTSSIDNVRILSPEEREKRYQEVGLAYRISDILADNISTFRDNDGRKGLLIQKVGIGGDSSQYSNYFYDKISDYEEELDELYDKLADKEDTYYSRFTALETAMSQLQSQADYITSMLGGSSG